MRLLEPFAGLRLLARHPVFHLAFFGAGWFLPSVKDTKVDEDQLYDAFIFLRYAHCVLFFLSYIEYWLRK